MLATLELKVKTTADDVSRCIKVVANKENVMGWDAIAQLRCCLAVVAEIPGSSHKTIPRVREGARRSETVAAPPETIRACACAEWFADNEVISSPVTRHFFHRTFSGGFLRIIYNVEPLRVRRSLGVIVVVPVPPLVRLGLWVTFW